MVSDECGHPPKVLGTQSSLPSYHVYIVPVPRALLTHLRLTSLLQSRYYYCYHRFRGGETEAQRGSDLPGVPPPVRGRAGIQMLQGDSILSEVLLMF